MNKEQKLSRKAMRNEIRNLRHDLEVMHGDLIDARRMAEDYRRRFIKLGMDENLRDLTVDEPVKQYAGEIEVEPSVWGQYMVLTDKATDEIIDMVSERLAESLARSLIKAGYARVIVRQPEPPDFIATIGVKLAVVPWEELTELAAKFGTMKRLKVKYI